MTPARMTVCLLTGLEAVVVAAVAVFYVVELARGAGADEAGVISSVVLFVVVAGALAAMAAGWWQRAAWPRTATIVWNLVLVPVAIDQGKAGNTLLAAGLGVVVVVAVGSALLVPAGSDHGLEGADGSDGPDGHSADDRGGDAVL